MSGAKLLSTAMGVGLLLVLATYWFGLCAVAYMKGHRGLAFVGLVLHLFAWIGALKLARPESWWAVKYYGEVKLAKARARYWQEGPASQLNAENQGRNVPTDPAREPDVQSTPPPPPPPQYGERAARPKATRSLAFVVVVVGASLALSLAAWSVRSSHSVEAQASPSADRQSATDHPTSNDETDDSLCTALRSAQLSAARAIYGPEYGEDAYLFWLAWLDDSFGYAPKLRGEAWLLEDEGNSRLAREIEHLADRFDSVGDLVGRSLDHVQQWGVPTLRMQEKTGSLWRRIASVASTVCT
jgi:hypothetical protein